MSKVKKKIRKGQIIQSKSGGVQMEIGGKKDAKWLAKVLTDKPGVYNGSHRMSEYTIRQKFLILT